MADRCWSDADREAVAAEIEHSRGLIQEDRYDEAAAAVLDALTSAGWHRGHCPTCDCPDVPYEGPPGTGRLVMDGDADG